MPPTHQHPRHRRGLAVDSLKYFCCLKCAPGSLSISPAAASLRLIQTRWSGRRCQVVLIAQLSPPTPPPSSHLKRYVLTDVAPCWRWHYLSDFSFCSVGNTFFVGGFTQGFPFRASAAENLSTDYVKSLFFFGFRWHRETAAQEKNEDP